MNSSQLFESYLPVYDAAPDTWEEERQFLVEQLKKVSNAVNDREIGYFLNEILLTGKAWFPKGSASQVFRPALRVIVDFGTLPNASAKYVAHNIPNFAALTLTEFGARATNPGVAGLSIPYASPTLNKNIQLDITSTDVVITTAIDYSAYTVTYVVIEYIYN